MENMNPDQKEKIVKILSERGANNPCPRCNNKNFTLLEGYFNQSIQMTINAGITLGGPSIPSLVVICTNCGYISQHALGILGLLPKEAQKNG